MTPAYERVLDALGSYGTRVQKHNGQARAQCPAHRSRGLTLAVKRTDDGALLHCHAGCEAADVLAALHLGLRDLFDEAANLLAPVIPIRRSFRRATPNPLGDVEHFCTRILQQERIEADPGWQRSRADELAFARRPRPGDYCGRSVTLDEGA